MFGFLSFPGQHTPLEDIHPSEPDDLNRLATEIAINLIEGNGSELYLNGMKSIFRASPRMIDDVAPEYQELLRKVLED